jgi:hypothetical protein
MILNTATNVTLKKTLITKSAFSMHSGLYFKLLENCAATYDIFYISYGRKFISIIGVFKL